MKMTDYNLNYLKTPEALQEMRNYLKKDYYRTTPLEVLTIENGIVLPSRPADREIYPYTWMGLGGVLDSEGNFVEMSGIPRADRPNDFSFGGKYVDCEIYVKEDTVLYMGAFSPHWGHFLVDYCTRLWYCLRNNYDGKIVYCGFNCKEGELDKPYADFFSLLNIKQENLIDIRKPTRFKKIIIPESAYFRSGTRYFTQEYRNLIDFVYQNIKSDSLIPYEKIYFSRVDFIKKSNRSREHGEVEIQRTFEKNGFKVFAPETLSVSEQIFYIRNCQEFVITLGSVALNAVFASEKCNVIIIRKGNASSEDNFQFNQMTNVKSATFIDCFYKPLKKYPISWPSGPHFLGATKEFLNFLEDRNMRKLSKGEYTLAILKTWIWLFKCLLHDYFRDFSRNIGDKRYYYLIRRKLGKIKVVENKQYIIYIYGRVGKIVKKVLNEQFSIHEKYIIRHSWDLQSVDCANFLSAIDTNCCILLACDNDKIYDEVFDLLLKYVSKDQIVELFPRKKSKQIKN